MSNQIQCPNCGGYKVVTEKTEGRHPSPYKPMIMALLGLPLLLFVIALIIVLFVMIVTIPLGILLYRAMQSGMDKLTGYQITKYWFTCELCGYRWTWKPGEAYPTIHVRPDLIAQGEQRLEEEHQKQQQDAAALYYLTHQGKK